MTGTVTVSYSLGSNSSVAAPIKAPAPDNSNACGKPAPCVSDTTKKPPEKATISMAILPAHNFLPSVSR